MKKYDFLKWISASILIIVLTACNNSISTQPTKVASINVKNAIMFYQLAKVMMHGGSDEEFHDYSNNLIQNHNMQYIERKEYWGEIPKLRNLAQLKLEDNCSAQKIIERFTHNIPEKNWESLNDKEAIYIRYKLPYYQRINKCLLPHKTRIVRIDFGSDNDYIIAIPTEDNESWKAWKKAIEQKKIKLIFYSPFSDREVLIDIKQNLPSISKHLTVF